MQKYLEILEKHVQWIALGIGGVFLLYMLYLYLPPVTAELPIGPGQKEVATLGDVDSKINDTLGKRLRTAVTDQTTPQIVQPNITKKFTDEVSNPGPATSGTLPNSPYYYIPWSWSSSAVALDPNTTINPALSAKISALPTLPKAVFDSSRSGRSQVGIPDTTVTTTAGTPGAANLKPEDRQWASVRFHVPMSELSSAFDAANMNQATLGQPATTYFASVELVRQLQLPDGNWGSTETVKSLLIAPKAPPVPTGDDPQEANDYRLWAGDNQGEIVQPAFYTVLKGDPWAPPGDVIEEAPAAAPTTPPPAPRATTPTPRTTPRTTPRSTTPRSGANPGSGVDSGGNTPGSSGGRSGRGNRSIKQPDRPESMYPAAQEMDSLSGMELAQSSPGAPGGSGSYGPPPGSFGPPPGSDSTPGGYGSGLPGIPGYGGSSPGGSSPGGSTPGAPGSAPRAGLPRPGSPRTPSAGAFAPAADGKDIDLWAHDDSVQAGKTYRYAIRYRLFNPIYGSVNLANPPELQNQLTIESELSDWSPPVHVPELVQFAIQGGIRPNATKISFEVFRWANGSLQSHIFRDVAPGDMIGGVVDGVDFSTGYTLVDLPPDHRPNEDLYVLVVDSDGVIHRRDYRTDLEDPAIKKLRDAAKAEADAAAAAAGTGTGAGTTAGRPPTGSTPGAGGTWNGGIPGLGGSGQTPGGGR